MRKAEIIKATFKTGDGIFRLIPNFVPRNFAKPGYRLRLHPDDYFAFGISRGAIKERWFSSIVRPLNGPETLIDEGLSYVSVSGNSKDKFLFKDACDILGKELIGEELYLKYGTWPIFAKFFDYGTPLYHHFHPNEEAASQVGMHGKPESYYFPKQLNNYLGELPVTYFGFDPIVSKEDVRQRLIDYDKRDIRITELSRAYRIELGTGWYTPTGVLHAPGSILTYEPQWNSDIASAYENVVSGEVFLRKHLNGICPEDKKNDVDYILSMLDWEKNVDPDYKRKYFRPPIECVDSDNCHIERWICYANPYISAKELTVMPRCTVTIHDNAAYGCVIIQGHGSFGVFNDAESATILKFGQLSGDEYFVSEDAAKNGVTISNASKWEPMVILKHFGPNNLDMPTTVK
ncbi:MAG TPA: hypothetical protein DDW65_08905 [Firmicutes bacterium]|jgi:hypothetical protein|nr:hypothetical protein [Bacillota bacterium]